MANDWDMLPGKRKAFHLWLQISVQTQYPSLPPPPPGNLKLTADACRENSRRAAGGLCALPELVGNSSNTVIWGPGLLLSPSKHQSRGVFTRPPGSVLHKLIYRTYLVVLFD